MNLDDVVSFRELDTQNMRRHMDSLPDQLETAWQQGQTYPLPESFMTAERLVIAGMGSSALAGDMLTALVKGDFVVPIQVCRGYELPAFIDHPGSLIVIVSYSGTTEETLSALNQAFGHQAMVLVLTANAYLAQQAEQ